MMDQGKRGEGGGRKKKEERGGIKRNEPDEYEKRIRRVACRN